MPRVKPGFGLPSRPIPMSPVAMPTTSPFSPKSKFGCRKTRVDFNAEALRARAEPPCQRAKGADKVAVVAHQPRHRPIRQPHAAGFGQVIEVVVRDLAFSAGTRDHCANRAQAGRARSGSITAPERICAPTTEPFSTTTTEMLGSSDLTGWLQRALQARRRRRQRRTPSIPGREAQLILSSQNRSRRARSRQCVYG